MERSRTKLVCTIGPASIDLVGDMVAAGMDVARVNFSHGTPDDHRNYVHAVRAAAHSARRSVAVMVDLPGPKIRLGELEGGKQRLETGTEFTLETRRTGPRPTEPAPAAETMPVEAMSVEEAPAEAAMEGLLPEPTETTDTTATEALIAEPAPVETPPGHNSQAEAAATPTAERPGDARRATVSRPTLHMELAVGDRILLADGAVELRVTALEEGAVRTEVVHGGIARSRSGVNIPSERLVGPGLTDEDREAVPQALELRADLIAQSFVRTVEDVKALRELLPNDGPRVVAKIETRVAVDSFDAIVAEADGIMVARGDLGVDIPFEDVPLVQKDLIRRATSAGRFAIVATQMLESMTAAARPTRAEASDVANAVLDGTDAVMLSAETAIGAYPLDALQAMARICVAAERAPTGEPTAAGSRDGVDPSASIVMGASLLADNAEIGAVWCFTRSGRTAELLSLQRPRVPIVAFTLSPIVARRLAVRSAVVPVVMPSGAKGGPLIERMENAWRSQHGPGGYDTVLLVTTSPQPSGINRLELHRLAGTSASR